MEWISIEDQIPDKEVLCVSKMGYYLIGYVSVTEHDGVIAESNDERLRNVTHWMPLPEPPKK